ncbi:MAG: hypothetical protein LJE91_15965 [Gammaproteobacteria bacterium]|jgi:hypothetical protein|nr:hypothetical protein [Gammaproteobacteria bacterium]
MAKLTILITLFALAASTLGAESVRCITDEAEIPAGKGKGTKVLAGAAVALGSLLLGLDIPRIPWRRRKGWSEC